MHTAGGIATYASSLKLWTADLPGKSKKRAMRDARYGFGGRKKLQKQNSADSSADMNAMFKDKRKSYGGKAGGKGPRSKGAMGVKGAGVKKRPGKSVRQVNKGKAHR
jgi:rRNA-processing protein EBP2